MEKSYIWKEPIKVRSYHMDRNARTTLISIAGYLQEAAGNHADSMNFGFKDMQKSGLVWLLTRMKIFVHQYPGWGDEIVVSTWVVNAEKFFSRRDFEIHDSSGSLLVSAISGWMLVNSKEKRPHLVDHVRDSFFIMPDKKAIDGEIQKIEALAKVDSSSLYQVKYSDIDIVGHVNNIQYYAIILDSLSFNFRNKNHIKSFEINYLAEALPGEELEVQIEQLIENKEHKYEIKRISDQKAICRAIIQWEND